MEERVFLETWQEGRASVPESAEPFVHSGVFLTETVGAGDLKDVSEEKRASEWVDGSATVALPGAAIQAADFGGKLNGWSAASPCEGL
jgi:hypothetical protein